MRNGKQLWLYGDWKIRTQMEQQWKQTHKPKPSSPSDIFKFGITQLGDDIKVYNRNSGVILFEAESYDEAQRVLRERYEEESAS